MNSIDISKKLTNEKPRIKIAEGKEYEMDNSMSTMIKMNNFIKDKGDIDVIEETIIMVLGKEAAEEIKKMSLSLDNYKTIFIAIMAGVNGQTFEEAEENFNKPSK